MDAFDLINSFINNVSNIEDKNKAKKAKKKNDFVINHSSNHKDKGYVHWQGW